MRRGNKYLSAFAIAVRSQLQYLPALVSRNVFFIFILFIFYSLWRVVFADRPVIAGFTMQQTLWYLTITETVELSKARAFAQIQTEVKDGSIAYSLLRPIGYPFFKIPGFIGESMVRAVPVLIEGFIIAALLAGLIPGYFRALPAGLLLIVGGIVLNTLWYTAIGLLAFWTEEVSPFYFIMQKLIFILGGLFFPVDFFPERLAAVSKILPFSFVAYWPAKIVVDFSFDLFLYAFFGQLIYIAIFAAIVVVLFESAKRRVHVQGG